MGHCQADDSVPHSQVVSFAGDLLSAAEGLLRDGLHTSEVADGYAKAAAKVSTTSGLRNDFIHCSKCRWAGEIGHAWLQALEILETLIIPGSEKIDLRDKKEVGWVALLEHCHVTPAAWHHHGVYDSTCKAFKTWLWVLQVALRIKASVCTKQYGYEDLLCPLIAQVLACIAAA